MVAVLAGFPVAKWLLSGWIESLHTPNYPLIWIPPP
jgi:hypothetical protein